MEDLQTLLDTVGGLSKLKKKAKGFTKNEFRRVLYDFDGTDISTKAFNLIWDKLLS